MRKTMRISGLLLALLVTWGANAAGLGKLTVQSALGQPLKAEIELLSVSKGDLADISARLANAEAYRQARVERQEALGNLNFSVDQRANGQPVIRITSSTPVADPFLEMLIELNWSSGRLIREYTVLLDPPERFKPPEPAPRAVAPVASGTASPAATPARPRPPAPPAADTPRRYGPVKSGETLHGIANKLKPAEVTLEQMIVGLYQANSQAFQGNNMNRLNRGQVLEVPDLPTLQANSQGESLRTIRGHVAEWQAYRRQVAEMAGEAAPPAMADDSAAGRIAPRADDKAQTPAPARDVLQLSKGAPGGAGKPDAKTQEKIQSLEEELAAKARALQEAQDRVGQLERTVQDMQQLLELKSQEAAAPPIMQEEPPAPVVSAAPPAPPTPAAVVPPPPVTDNGGSWLSTFIGNPLYIGGLVAALLLSALLWMMMVGSRRRQGLTKFEDSIMTGGEFKNNAVFNAPAAGSGAGAGAATEGSMLLTDFSRLGMGAIDSHEVDPIAEAEVYMAYGRDAQAEEILKEALGKDPGRYEISLKLLEIYAARKDTMAFETAASELYAALGGQNTPIWQRAAEMGRSIDSDNPLYRVAGAPSDSSMFTGAAAAAATTAAILTKPADAVEVAAPSEFAEEENLAAPAAAEDFGAAPAEDEGVLEFTPAEDKAWGEAAPLTSPEPKESGETAEAGDFEFGMPEIPEEETSTTTQPETEEPADMAAFMPEPEEVETPPAESARVVEDSDATTALEFELGEQEPSFEDMPVLDLSGIDLELDDGEQEVEAELADVPDLPAGDEALPEAEDLAPEAEAELPADMEVAEEFEAQPAAEEEAEPEAEPEAVTEPVGEEPFSPDLREEVNTKLDLARAYLEMGDQEGAREILQEVINEGDAAQKSEAEKLLAEAS